MSSPSAEEYEAAGLYDPSAPDADDRLRLLGWLQAMGVTVDELRSALDYGALSSVASDRWLVPGERLRRDDAIERSGLDPEAYDAYVTALGYEPIQGAPDGEVGITEAEIDLLASMEVLTGLFERDEALSLVRVIGSALARIAEATISLFLADVESAHVRQGGSEFELAQTVYEAVQLIEDLGARLDPALRRHMLQAAERTRATTIDAVERFQYRYAVGFVDLVGFTTISRDMSAEDLSAFVGRFERTAHEVVSGAGARVVKLIGDEVMFVDPDPNAAVDAGRALIDTFSSMGDGVLPRGGMAYGSVVLRGGDYYGSVVNIASRLADAAVPGELLVTTGIAEATDCEFEPAGRRMLKGFDAPITVLALPG
ncbi:MAG: adenylate cyclase regulatory domain-containing protein [Ilumatobacter fluminis]|uniref:Class 3 adenylate cyclase n=1 Tax=Ilumatobacter fluminis TaxID=467091 RepID=A0A4R7HVK5_9ACTN|nr:adenylate/guanylate cyclase domain-containing protein [Ilumatobacter fluminis]TDT14865.1 class 3 adenylate cyclase [Ilumatobacter fluminis]